MNNELKEHVPAGLIELAKPLILSVLNVTMPLLVKEIVKAEGHFRSIEVLQLCMQRIYIVKMVQLSTILFSLMQIMRAREAREGHAIAARSDLTALP